MQRYEQSSNETGLELWPDFEDEGVEVLEGNPKQSGRIEMSASSRLRTSWAACELCPRTARSSAP